MTQPQPPVDPAGPLGWLNDLAVPPPGPAPLQASDPVTYRGAITIPKATTPQVGGGSFHVDRERAPEAIWQLKIALEDLRGLRKDAVTLGRVSPPAYDRVSVDAAARLSATAVGGSGSLLHALDGGIRRLQELIDALRADVREYERSDTGAAASFPGETLT